MRFFRIWGENRFRSLLKLPFSKRKIFSPLNLPNNMPIPVFGSFLKKEKKEVGVNCCYSSFFFSFLFPGKLCACPCHSTAWGLGRAPLLSCQSVGRRKSENAEFELTAISRTKNVENFSRKKLSIFFYKKPTVPTINLASFCSFLLINDPRLISHIQTKKIWRQDYLLFLIRET